MAFGNGAPDIFSAVGLGQTFGLALVQKLTQTKAAFTAEEESTATMAIGSLLGAGMFVIMVVSGSCMIIKVELDSNEL